MPDQHSTVVGGSNAKRVLNCPGCRREIAKAPRETSSEFADRGTLLHEATALILDEQVKDPVEVIGMEYKGITLTEDLYREKIDRALTQFIELTDEFGDWEFEVESKVELRSIPGAFGTADIIGKAKDRTIVLDWKFGDGVLVSAKDSEQGMFYAGAAMETPALQDLFTHKDDWPVEIIIVQPVNDSDDIISRWTTTVGRIKRFVLSLAAAVRDGERPDAPLARGDWCQWCPAQPRCPEYLGLAENALKQDLATTDPDEIGRLLDMAEEMVGWVAAVKKLGHTHMDHGFQATGWKLVQKRATRKWADKSVARKRLVELVSDASSVLNMDLISPAQAEKVLKKEKIEYDEIADLVSSVSSGTTLAPADDPRPAVQVAAAAIKSVARKLKHANG